VTVVGASKSNVVVISKEATFGRTARVISALTVLLDLKFPVTRLTRQVVLDCDPAFFFKAAATSIMEIPEKISGENPPPSRKRSAWWWLLLLIFILIPVPFGHWWLTISSLAICFVLAWLLVRLRN
jgi:hypothetical protein